MVREIAVEIYLVIFRLFFHLFRLFPLKDKTIFVTSFTENVDSLILTLYRRTNLKQKVIILKNSNIKLNFNEKINLQLLNFNSLNHSISSIYHLATSKNIIIDNYYGFLAVTNFKKDVKCIQIWHAVGAFKQFGLKDLTNQYRSKRTIKRFNSVYKRFSHVVVGSERMKEIFQKSFDLPSERFITTGIPRTDFFFNDSLKNSAMKQLKSDFPMIKGKKVMLYAPTYRDGIFKNDNLQLDLQKMYDNFKDDYVLLVRLHPTVTSQINNEYPGFLIDASGYFSINHLLLGTDILITDYSSIPFEFSLLERPMIFFAYDLDEYKNKRGLWGNYKEILPGPIVKSTNELIDTINHNQFSTEKIKKFAKEWNKYSNGNSSEQLIKILL